MLPEPLDLRAKTLRWLAVYETTDCRKRKQPSAYPHVLDRLALGAPLLHLEVHELLIVAVVEPSASVLGRLSGRMRSQHDRVAGAAAGGGEGGEV